MNSNEEIHSCRIFSVVLLLLLSPFIPYKMVGLSSADTVSEFGIIGQPTTVNLTFSNSGYDVSTNITLGQTTVVSTASFDVRGLSDTLGERPNSIGIDIGDDGDLEWAFGGPGNGSYGYLDEFSNGRTKVGLNLSTGQNNSYSLRLPADAVVNSATLNISSLSELVLTGSDVRDSYLHRPNPTWGNVTYYDCNYGAAPHVVLGKTQWTNWHIYRGVFWFDLSAIPGAEVQSSTLEFYVDDVVSNANTGQPVTTPQTYTLYPLLKDWTEGLENNMPVQQASGITWNNAMDNLTGVDYAWTTTGASSRTSDRGSSIDSLVETPANMEGTWITFNSTNFTNQVQEWVNGSSTNFGILFQGSENTNKPDGSMIKITSSENLTHGPKLTVTFAGENDVSAGLDVNSDGIEEWAHTGNLSSGTTTPDFSSLLNAYLSSATPTFVDLFGNEFVDVPLSVRGNATLVLDDLELYYDWTPTLSSSPHGSFADEFNEHLVNFTADASGNVSIPINVTSGSNGIVELSNLLIQLGARPPSIGAIILPTDVIVPNDQGYVVGAEVTSYQGLANLSLLTLTPLLADINSRPIFHYHFSSGSVTVSDSTNLVTNLTSNILNLNSDTTRIELTFSATWNWVPEQNVVWEVELETIDALSTSRISSQMTTHERRMEIISLQVEDETYPTDGAPDLQNGEWVAGGDNLRCTGVIRFLGTNSNPTPGDVVVELVNLTGNGTTDSNGIFNIITQVPDVNYYNGFTFGAHLLSSYDVTPPESAQLMIFIDSTAPGIQINSPLGERVTPDHQNLFNVSIADSVGLPDIIAFYWWVEGMHDDGDGIPELSEYSYKDLMRQVNTDYFHASFDDTSNSEGQMVSLFIEGTDYAGNAIDGGSYGFEQDLIHFSSLVPTPSNLLSTTLEYSQASAIVPTNPVWLNFSLHDDNLKEDIELIKVDFGQDIEFEWNFGTNEMVSNEIYLYPEQFIMSGDGTEIDIKIQFVASPWFDPVEKYGDLTLHVKDSSGSHIFDSGFGWNYNSDIHLSDFVASNSEAINGDILEQNGWVALGSTLNISGMISYANADIPPPDECYSAQLKSPSGNQYSIDINDNGIFSGSTIVQSNGIYEVELEIICGGSQIIQSIHSITLRVDENAPTLVASEPSFISANSTELNLQFDISEPDSGLPYGTIALECSIRRDIDTVGDAFVVLAEPIFEGSVSRYKSNISVAPLVDGEVLECWMDLTDVAGNSLVGTGSSFAWPIELHVVEQRPDLVSYELNVFPNPPTVGELTLFNVTIANLGEHTAEEFVVSMWIFDEEVGNSTTRFLGGRTTTTVSFEWKMDWVGELEIVILVDPDNDVLEQDETNIWRYDVQVEEEARQSIFQSNIVAISGISIALLFATAFFLLNLRNRNLTDSYEEWADDEYEDEDDDEDKDED